MSREVAILVWGLVAIAGIMVLGLIAWWTRRWFHTDDRTDSGPAFTLQDLREMRDRGALSEEEFQRMRSDMLAAYHSDRPRDGSSGASE